MVNPINSSEILIYSMCRMINYYNKRKYDFSIELFVRRKKNEVML